MDLLRSRVGEPAERKVPVRSKTWLRDLALEDHDSDVVRQIPIIAGISVCQVDERSSFPGVDTISLGHRRAARSQGDKHGDGNGEKQGPTHGISSLRIVTEAPILCHSSFCINWCPLTP